MSKLRPAISIVGILIGVVTGATLITQSQQVFLGASAYFPNDNLLEAIQDSIESPQRIDLNALAFGEPIVVAVSQFSEPKLAETLISTKSRLSATVQVLLESPMESADSNTPTNEMCGELVNNGIKSSACAKHESQVPRDGIGLRCHKFSELDEAGPAERSEQRRRAQQH